MKRSIFLLSIILLFAFGACNDEQDAIPVTETGTVIDMTGPGNCSILIELDNGKTIQPLYYPEGFVFTSGQRVLVEFAELEKVTTGCDTGIPCEVIYVEELSCSPFIEPDSVTTDSLANDPVHLHEAFIDGNCLYFKLSYSGGCQDHTIDLVKVTGISSALPVLEIRHNANDDLCEAWITREFRYDISALRLEGATQLKLKAKLLSGETFEEIFDLIQE